MEKLGKQLSLKVSVRIKPCGDQNISTRPSSKSGCVTVDNESFGRYSSVIPADHDQDSSFRLFMQPLVDSFQNGYNCTIFMYGQTGSGKTHTLFGPPKFFNCGFDQWGMCPRVVDMLLNNKDSSATLHVSALEVYFDECFDLL